MRRRIRLSSFTSPPSSSCYFHPVGSFLGPPFKRWSILLECIPSSLFHSFLFLKCREKTSSSFSTDRIFQRKTRKRSCFRTSCRLTSSLLPNQFSSLSVYSIRVPYCFYLFVGSLVFWRVNPLLPPCCLECINRSLSVRSRV